MAGSGTAHMRNTVDAVLTVRDLTVEFRVAKDKIVKAVSGLSFDVIKGETLAIVGESGCGKTTLARAVLQLPPPNSGEVAELREPMLSCRNQTRPRSPKFHL